MRIPVVDEKHQPLMPTTPSRVRKWIELGKAVKRWSDSGQFYVQLTVKPSGRNIQDIVVGLDPGKNFSGIGVQSHKVTLYAAHLVLPFELVKSRMESRRVLRKARRSRRINRKVEFSKRSHRQKRFNNRRNQKVAPSIRSNRQLELRVISELNKIYPISEIRYEYVRADVDISSGRRAARRGRGFSPVMVGQIWMIKQLEQIAPVVKVYGYQTSSVRNHLGLVKNPNKSKSEFATHAVDGVALACSHFVEYRKYHSLKEDSAAWFGDVAVTSCEFFMLRRPPYNRRQLHISVPDKKSIKRKYGGSQIRFNNLRKGDLVKGERNGKISYGWISGDNDAYISVSDIAWKRVRFTPKKVLLIKRSTGLLVAK